MIVESFNDWQSLNEQEKLDIKLDKPSKAKRKKDKSNRRKYRKDNWISDSGSEYILIRKKDASGNETDTFVLKGKNKKSPVWDKEGKLVDDVKDFLSHELMSGQNEGKYDEDSIEMEKYREGKNRDRVKFTIGFAKEESKDEKPEEKKLKYEKIELPKNAEGETRIDIGQESEALPKIKEILRVAFSKKGFTLGKKFGMDWLDQAKLEEKDAKWIKGLRIGFGMADAKYISQGLVDNIVDHANEWSEEKSEAKEEVASNESFFLNFSDYMKVFEEFDVAAAMKAMNSEDEEKEEKPEEEKGSKKDSDAKASTSQKSGLTDEQAVAYRTWANSDDVLKKAYGKPSKFDLDATGTNNSYVSRSYAQAKKDLDGKTGVFADDKYVTTLNNTLAGEAVTEGLPMGYIQWKTGNRIAIHFANPRPVVGTVKAGDIVIFKNGWDAADFGYAVKDVWKDANGNLGAIYIESPSYVEEFGKTKKDKSFEGKASIVVATQQETSNLKDMFVRTATDDNQAIWISNKIKTFWTNSNNFTAFKGAFNDNEAGAIALFTTWWNKNMAPNIEKLRKNDPNKATLTRLFNTIITKAEGGTSDDTARWKISTMGGNKSYSVDTDF